MSLVSTSGPGRREIELAALYETVSDLTGLRDVDKVLAAIVHRSRRLVSSDAAYLMLVDEERGDAYMRVTEGTVSPDYGSLRLNLGLGLGGLVATTESAYYTSNYREDPRFEHVQNVDDVVLKEGVVAILGVPMKLRDKVIGVLFVADRQPRRFTAQDAALLQSLAGHASVAIENARLFEESQRAVRQLNEANSKIRAHSAAVERAASAHERFTTVVLSGGGLKEVASAVVESIGGAVMVVDIQGRVLGHAGESDDELHRPSVARGRIPIDILRWDRLSDVPVGSQAADRLLELAQQPGDASRRRAAPIYAGRELLGALIFTTEEVLDGAVLQTLERAALVTALVLLNERALAEAEQRVRGELLSDLLHPARVSDLSALQRRADLLSTDLTANYSVVVASASPEVRRRTEAAAGRLAASQTGLSGTHGDRIVLLLPNRPASEAARIVASELSVLDGFPVTVAAHGPVPAAQLPAAFEEAERCLRLLFALGREGDAATAEELGIYALLLSESSRNDLEAFVQRMIGPVIQHDVERGDALLETLEALFANSLNLRRTASKLHVHINTVYQRLERLDKLLPHAWRESDDALQVHLAVRLHNLARATESEKT